MATHTPGSAIASAVAPAFVLDRRQAVPALIGRHQDFLIVTGLAGTSRDVAALTEDGAHTYTEEGVYSITNVQVSHAGNYSVVVSNIFGSVTSSTALLTVNVPAPKLRLAVIKPRRSAEFGEASPMITFVTRASTLPLENQRIR
jgi:hypothetical protein